MDEEQKKEGENGTENFWEKGLEGEHHQSVPYIFMKCDNKDPSFHNQYIGDKILHNVSFQSYFNRYIKVFNLSNILIQATYIEHDT